VADEKHSWWLGQRVYLATTAAAGCILGVELPAHCDAEGLSSAYGVFASEALAHTPNYCPKSVNLDGWEATAPAWRNLFPSVSVILCFLHAILRVGQYCRLRRVREWSQRQNAPESVCLKVQSMASKAAAFSQAFAV
jgi:hypothetical protein